MTREEILESIYNKVAQIRNDYFTFADFQHIFSLIIEYLSDSVDSEFHIEQESTLTVGCIKDSSYESFNNIIPVSGLIIRIYFNADDDELSGAFRISDGELRFYIRILNTSIQKNFSTNLSVKSEFEMFKKWANALPDEQQLWLVFKNAL